MNLIKKIILLSTLTLLWGCGPEFTSEPVKTATEGQFYKYYVTAKDPKHATAALTIEAKKTPHWLSLSYGELQPTLVKHSGTPVPFASLREVFDSHGNLITLALNSNVGISIVTPDGTLSESPLASGLYIDRYSGMVVYGNTVYVSTSSGIYTFDTANLQAPPVLFDSMQNNRVTSLGYTNGYLYALEPDKGQIERINTRDSSDKATVVSNLTDPIDMSINPIGQMFVVQNSDTGNVLKYKLGFDGKSYTLDHQYTIPVAHGDLLKGFVQVLGDLHDNIYLSLQVNTDQGFLRKIPAGSDTAKTLDGRAAGTLVLNPSGKLMWFALSRKADSILLYNLDLYSLNTNTVVLSGTPTNNDVGQDNQVKLLVREAGSTHTDTQSFKIDVKPLPKARVEIEGDPVVGRPLSIKVTNPDGVNSVSVESHEWKNSLGTVIEGNSTFTPSLSDVGTSVTVTLRYTYTYKVDNVSYEGFNTVTSEAVVIRKAPEVSIAGGSLVGQVLNANITANGEPGTFSYQWYRNGVAIDSATESAYTLTETDIGAVMTVKILYGSAPTSQESVMSTNSITVIRGVDLDNTAPSQGNTLHAVIPTDYNTADYTFTYKWYRNGKEVLDNKGASLNQPAYVLGQQDVGQAISVGVTYTNVATNQVLGSFTSSATAAVANVNDVPTCAGIACVVNISGDVVAGQTLTAALNGTLNGTLIDVDGTTTSTLHYVWADSDGKILTSVSGHPDKLLLTNDQVGKQVTATISYTDDGGYPFTTSLTSGTVTAAVANYTNVSLSSIGSGSGGIQIKGGIFPGGQIGDAIATGDVNGDGISDLIIGSPTDNFNDGSVYVVFGQAGGWSADIDLANVGSSVPGFKIIGVSSSGDQLGAAVAYVADMNGDGKGEIVIGAPSKFDGSNVIGSSYVVFGKADTSIVDVSTLASTNKGFAIIADANDGLNGNSVASAGDVNGDGVPDVIIGAYGASSGNGAAYVVFGKSTSTAVDLAQLTSTNDGFAIIGDTLSNTGISVSSLGDISGDGKSDLVVSAPGDPSASDTRGKTYVILGKASSSAVNVADLVSGGANDAGGYAIIGEKNDDFSGDSITAVGDVNGDGKPDIAIGAQFFHALGSSTRQGRTYIVFGGTAMTADVNLSSVVTGTGGYYIDGDVSEEIHLGLPVVPLGKVDGDSMDDFAVGAYGTDTSGSSGAAYVVFGKSDTSAVKVTDLNSATGGYKLSGQSGDVAGRALAAADFNGDGKIDLLVGAPGNNKVYIVYGK